MTEANKIDVLGVAFDNLTMDEALDRGWALMDQRRAAYVVTPNPEIVMACGKDPEAAAAVKGASLTIADGIGILYAAKLLGTPVKEKLPGIDFSTRLMERMAGEGRSVFLFGSKPGVAEAAWEKLRERFPGLKLAGTHDGYFQDDAPIVAQINAAAPDLLLVCLGAPKQEKWMYRHAPELKVGLMIGNGGSLDVFAGNVERAPEAWQRLGLEWLYRLKKEPWRIRRMAKLPLILLQALGARGRKGK